MAKVPTVKCRKDVLTSTWTCCQGHQHHQNLRGEIPNWMCVLIPNMTMPPKFKAPKFEKIQWEGRPHDSPCKSEWYSQLKKISHWKGLADTFLAQYGLNSQIEPDCFDRQRMEKKSSEIFREYTQWWRRNGGLRACPLLDEKEMIKIFVDTLKNPYFDRIVGLQLQFLVDLILVEERIEDAVKTKRMVDMPALMALVEQIAKRTLVEKNEEGV
uniref:Retrotransposon gag domain-containing protein n=1 Tax=Fagus sylvatica TaxID=28930 RepID=A0A2N9FD52_FAGSY